MKILERNLYEPIKKNYCKRYDLFYEIRLHNRIIDILLFRKKNLKPIIAMEFKIKDWKKALIQAYSYLTVANYVYIVLYYKYIKNIKEHNFKIFKKNGIGLISASTKNYKIILKARKNNIIDEELQDKILKTLNLKRSENF